MSDPVSTQSTRSDLIDTVEGILLDEERGEFGGNVQRRWLAEVIVEALSPASDQPLKPIPADFNNVGPHGTVKVGRRTYALEVGERVLLYDAEGNNCVGVVTGVKRVGYVELDQSTWKDGPA